MTLMKKLKHDTLQMITSINTRHKTGLNLTCESPTCCPNYAEVNIDRGVPIRQYFGKTLYGTTNKMCNRYVYGVGSGASTVGGDKSNNRTRNMTYNMEQLCICLNDIVNNHLPKDGINEEVCFNHVTVLFYKPSSNTDNNSKSHHVI